MRVLVCGGRDFGIIDDERDFIMEYLEETLPADVVIISGAARGADSVAIEFARVWEEDCMIFPAKWSTFGKKAGFIRNQQMIDEGKPDLVIAFPGGNGTRDMISRAKKAGIEVIEVEYAE